MATINRYSTPVQNSLEEYVPMTMDMLFKSAAAIQNRGDAIEDLNNRTEFGLASTEALAPAYKEFINQYTNDYKTKAGDLLAKYNNNTSNPEFIRESKRLNTQFASDPRLQIIRQGNEQIKANEALSNKLQAEGRLFIKPQFTGKDSLGNLTSNVANVEGVNVLDDWAKAGSIAHQSTEDLGRGNISNIRNLNRWKQAIQNDALGQTKLLQAYMSQGYTPEQAKFAVDTQIKGLINQYGVESRHDYGFDNLQLAKQKAAEEQVQNRIPNLLPFEEEYSQVVTDNFRAPQLKKIDNVLNNLNEAGGLKKGIQSDLKLSGYSTGYSSSFTADRKGQKEQYRNDEYQVLREARSALGALGKNSKGQWLSDKNVLQKYRDVIANDNTVYNFMKPNNADYLKAISKVKVGEYGQNIGSEYTVFTADGKTVSNDKKGENPLKSLKGFEFAGLNPTSFGKYEHGTIKINAVDENGNPVQILKPMNQQEQRLFTVPNQLYKLMNSDKTNEDLAKSPIKTKQGNIFVQKGVTSDGKMGMKAYLQTANGVQEIDVNGLIDGVMGQYYNFQQPYENLK